MTKPPYTASDGAPKKDILYQKIRRALDTYHFINQSPKDPEQDFGLVDALTPQDDRTIERGIEELDNLADYIFGEIS